MNKLVWYLFSEDAVNTSLYAWKQHPCCLHLRKQALITSFWWFCAKMNSQLITVLLSHLHAIDLQHGHLIRVHQPSVIRFRFPLSSRMVHGS